MSHVLSLQAAAWLNRPGEPRPPAEVLIYEVRGLLGDQHASVHRVADDFWELRWAELADVPEEPRGVFDSPAVALQVLARNLSSFWNG